MTAWLASVGKDLAVMAPKASLGRQAGGVHVFRHSAAKLRRDAGQSVEEVRPSSTTAAWP